MHAPSRRKGVTTITDVHPIIVIRPVHRYRVHRENNSSNSHSNQPRRRRRHCPIVLLKLKMELKVKEVVRRNKVKIIVAKSLLQDNVLVIVRLRSLAKIDKHRRRRLIEPDIDRGINRVTAAVDDQLIVIRILGVEVDRNLGHAAEDVNPAQSPTAARKKKLSTCHRKRPHRKKRLSTIRMPPAWAKFNPNFWPWPTVTKTKLIDLLRRAHVRTVEVIKVLVAQDQGKFGVRTTSHCASASTHTNRITFRSVDKKKRKSHSRSSSSSSDKRTKSPAKTSDRKGRQRKSVSSSSSSSSSRSRRSSTRSPAKRKYCFCVWNLGHFLWKILTSLLLIAEDKSRDYEIHKSENSVQKKRHYRTNKDSSRSESPEKLKDRRNDRSFNRRSNSRTRRNSRNRNRSRNRSRSPRRDNRDR